MCLFISLLFLLLRKYRTKWKRQTAVGLELFVEAGNYAAYQRAYASRYGQMDHSLSSYAAANSLMMPGAGPIMPPSNLPSVESYYQQLLQSGMNNLPAAHANLFAAPHRPLPMMPNAGFLPLSPPNSLYPASRLTSISSPAQQQQPHHSPEHTRPNSLSPVATSPATHSPKVTQPWAAKAQSTTNLTSDNESDIEV